MLKQLFLIATLALAISWNASAQADTEWKQKFEQLGPMLPTPNTYRTASGAPGKDYWQMQADYKMAVTLDDSKQQITGKETITYYNNSPDPLDYLWIQLDQNMRADDSDTPLANARKYKDTLNVKDYYGLANSPGFEGGFNVHYVKATSGSDLKYKINKTMMRVDLAKTLQPGEKVSFDIEWDYFINDRMTDGGRSGMEYFPEEDNYLYTIAQFFPRMAVYSDNEGWQNKQFLGSGEFALSFGSYEVAITVPSDFVIGSTGTLQNPKDVLTKDQQKRLAQAKKSFDKPVFIVTEEEAIANEKTKDSGTKTWVFQADSIRDFAFAASRKFIWDAMAVDINGKTPLAMSYYPKEGNPLWEEYSTRVVAQTLETYSKYTIDYPYSKAISVHTASIGMEYPMICFNYGRPNEDGTYSDRTKYGMIGVIIHEVGHNFFPMIINSDERPISWMLMTLSNVIEKNIEKKGYNLSVDEISHALEITTDKEATEEEKDMLKGIVNFSTLSVKQVMKSRIDITAIDIETDFHELMDKVNKTGYSRIPIYTETIDKIDGILYIKDLLPHLDKTEEFQWQTLLRPAFFVPESKKIDDLFKDFQEKQVHMAIVVDEYGGISGLTTLEDVIEEIVGEINDEFDEDNDIAYNKLDPNTYIFEGKTSLNDFCKITGEDAALFETVKGDSESLGGLLLELNTKLPHAGEKIEFQHFLFTVVAVDQKRIKRVRVFISSEKIGAVKEFED